MYYTIDRFEGDFAVCENRQTGEFVNIRKSEIPECAKEGDILLYENEKYVIDIQTTETVKNRIKEKMDRLWS